MTDFYDLGRENFLVDSYSAAHVPYLTTHGAHFLLPFCAPIVDLHRLRIIEAID